MTAAVRDSAGPPLRVASIPAAHPYVAGLGLAAAGVVTLPDPVPAGAPAGQWWPPVMLDPRWIGTEAGSFDVMHVHFGFESLTVGQLAAALDAVKQRRCPLILTVHDLENPQLADQQHHLRQLDLIVGSAGAIITLTEGAQAEILERWGRHAQVIPHPRVLVDSPTVSVAATKKDRSALEIGLPLRDLRPNIDGVAAIGAVIEAQQILRDDGVATHATVTLRSRVRDPAAAAEIRRLCAADDIDLIEQDRPDDLALAAFVVALDICLLPYRHGTHSGWLELCWDLGVPVVGPRHGHFSDQHHDPGFYHPVDEWSGDDLARVLLGQLTSPRPGSHQRTALMADRSAIRDTEQPAVAAAHVEIYRSLLGSRGQPRNVNKDQVG